MTYATLCSGIEGFGQGFDAAGMRCVFQCENDKHALRVLARHYPDVPRTEDVHDERTESELVRLQPDIVAFGSPCQDLSVAGKRAGLSGQRSGLFFVCVGLCLSAETGIVVWENVPGVFSSNNCEDFAIVLEAFTGTAFEIPRGGWKDTGVAVGPLYSVAWAVLDSQWFGLPQRRKRVFLVASLGNRGSPYQILSLAESVPWDTPPSRETGTRVAASLTRGAESSGRGGYAGRRREDDVNIVFNPHRTLQKDGTTAEGFKPDSITDALHGPTGNKEPLVVFQASDYANGQFEECELARPITTSADRSRAAPLVYGGNDTSGPRAAAAALNAKGGSGRADFESENFVVGTLNSGGNNGGVRRLTPLECLRLQGFSDTYLDIEGLSDSAKYRLLGNAVSTPVAEWIGRRIMEAQA